MRQWACPVAIVLATSSAHAQDEGPEPLPLAQPSDAPEEPPAVAVAPQKQKADEAQEAPQSQEDQNDESPGFAYFGIGPTMLTIATRDGAPPLDEYGLALSGGGRTPLSDRIALNVGFTWGLTTFSRTEKWWGGAQRVGGWTKRAYGNVTEWAEDGGDDSTLRWFAAIYAYVGLLFPYLVSGVMYVGGPLAATSYMDLNVSGSFHLLEIRDGPYVSAGITLMAYLHPTYDQLKGGLGPSLGAGYDFGWFGLEARGNYSPPPLHGEATTDRSDIFTGSLFFRFQGK